TTSATITGLTNGQAYHVTVEARNAAGVSAAVAAAPDPVTPRAAVPGPPTGIGLKPGDGSATVSWTAPAGAVKSYEVATQPTAAGQPVVIPAGTTSAVVQNLTNGTPYQVTVTAVGPSGGTSSATAGPVTPFGPAGAVSGISVTQSGATSFQVGFGGSAANGSAVTAYQATATPTGGGPSVTAQGSSSPLTLSGLTVGTTYAITVRAQNAGGWGTASSAGSFQVAPVATVSVTATAGSQSATVNISVATNGDPSPSGCVVEYSGGSAQGGCGTITVTGLTAGQAYSFDAYAVINGVGTARSASAPATPYYLTAVGHTLNSPTNSVNLHSGPAESDPVTGSKNDGDPIEVVCQTTGSLVKGTVSGQSDVWDKLVSGNWITDLLTDTPNSLNGTFSPGIAQC
ncbi:MAG: fibronectin type III domain-containing protein, partial [Acidimicrobiaceae bacterium]|nr:fibronectin type III domain-containing protein [Acidimicrobiaceae bacterium]